MKNYEPVMSFGQETAETYDDEPRGDEAAAVAFLQELANGGPALELAIGTGRIALPLTALGIRVDGIDADHLCAVLADKVHLSTGSACTSGQLRTSHVLEAMGFSTEEAAQVVRAFCHRYLDADDVRSAAAEVAAAIRQSTVATGGGLQ